MRNNAIFAAMILLSSCKNARGQVVPPPPREAGVQSLQRIVDRLPSTGGFSATYDLQSPSRGGSRRLIGCAFRPWAYFVGDGAGGFWAVDTQSQGFARTLWPNSRVESRTLSELPDAISGLGQMVPALYLRHFVEQKAALLDVTTLPQGGMTFRVLQDPTSRTFLKQGASDPTAEAFDLTFAVDSTDRVTSIITRSPGHEYIESYEYGESDSIPWFVPTRKTTSIDENWVLVEVTKIDEADVAQAFSRAAVTVAMATVEGQMKQDIIDRAGGFDVVAKQRVQDVLPIEGGGSGGRYFWIAGVVAAVGVVGAVVIVRKRRLAA